ncbi:ash family protein [Scandinavium goeteborgense]|uniref:ash family protein n=1 Tax=Scandinavium goeteborgense TaxID=1851514 RepID=UPI00105C11AD|nr:ash family protein [Scandinavium goeteborgense]
MKKFFGKQLAFCPLAGWLTSSICDIVSPAVAKSTAGFRSPKLTLRTHISHDYVLRLRSSVKRLSSFAHSMVAQAGQPSGWPGHLQGNRYCEPCLSYHQ